MEIPVGGDLGLQSQDFHKRPPSRFYRTSTIVLSAVVRRTRPSSNLGTAQTFSLDKDLERGTRTCEPRGLWDRLWIIKIEIMQDTGISKEKRYMTIHLPTDLESSIHAAARLLLGTITQEPKPALTTIAPPSNPLLGIWRDTPEEIDEIVAEAMQRRREEPL